MMEQSSSSLTASSILQALNDSNRRDELLACLDFIGHAQQSNQDLLSSQTLASFPAWLEEQGFSAEHLGSFFHEVDRIATPASPPESLAEIYASLGPEASVLQLVNVVAERSPIVYEVIVQTIEEAHHSAQELGAVGGGLSTKGWIKVGVGAVVVLGGIGLLVNKIRREVPDLRQGIDRERQDGNLQGLFNQAENDLQPALQNLPNDGDTFLGGLERLDHANRAAARLLVQNEAVPVNQRIGDAEHAEVQRIEFAGRQRLVAARDNLDPQQAEQLLNQLEGNPAARGEILLAAPAVAEAAADQLEQDVRSQVSSAVASEASQFDESFSSRSEEDVVELVREVAQEDERLIVHREARIIDNDVEDAVFGMEERFMNDLGRFA